MLKYEMLADSRIEKLAVKGTIVYPCRGPDYGLSRDESRILGYECISVTLNEDGSYPFFVVPQSGVRVIRE